MTWTKDISIGNEAAKIKYLIVPYTRGYGIDVGCSVYKPFAHFIGVDVVCPICQQTRAHTNGCPGAWHINIFHLADDLPIFASQSLDFVFSSHLIEHLPDPQGALQEWWRLIKPGGHLVLYVPDADLYPNIGQEGSNPSHLHDFRPQDVIALMQNVKGSGWDLVLSERRDQDNEYSFLQVYRKISGKDFRYSYAKKNPKKTCCVVRYGAIGDMVQTSSVIAALKDEGYHIVLNTTPDGYVIAQHDPNIDEFMIQDKDQVPNSEILAYWRAIARRFDKFVNLSESVEGSLLAMPGRAMYEMPKNIRHTMMNHNYLEFMHKVAGVPYVPRPKYWASQEEKKWAQTEVLALGGKVLMYTLAGSSIHKFWPHQDDFFQLFLKHYPDWVIVTVGDSSSSILEVGLDKDPRILCKAGKWSIGQTLALAELCNLVVGPETGVLNAVSHVPGVAKVVLLSHSSPENLVRDWPNTIAICPVECDCWPCHQMHTTDIGACPQDEATGAAICQAKITPFMVLNAAKALIDGHLPEVARGSDQWQDLDLLTSQ